MRRRLLIALLLVIALAGGLWWNATRLNETERKLVGAWENVGSASMTGVIFLGDGRRFSVHKSLGKWNIVIVYKELRWSATRSAVTFRSEEDRPMSSYRDWGERTWTQVMGKNCVEHELVLISDTAIEMMSQRQAGDSPWAMRRSTDPQLLALFDRLSAGESP